MTYKPADKTASQVFIELLPLINAKGIGLLDHRRLLDQLVALERRTAFGTGKDSVGHPPGAHDDVAVAVAGALVRATSKKGFLRVNGYRVGSDGKLINHPHPAMRSRDSDKPHIRIINVTEQEALRMKAEGTW